MGLYRKISDKIGKVFSGALSDAVNTFTLYKGENVYDPNTGNIILGETQSFTWRGVFSKANKRAIEDSGELPVEMEIICLADEADFPPDVNDYIITQTTSDTYDFQNCYRINRIDADPTISVYTLYVRSATYGPLQSRIFSGSSTNN
ncbi:MAG: hypothetical protein R3250_00010 [Melioribacteraceae bacterium]|nr:hypothetical protein [Melioribacteraceae bacterium]